MSYPPGFEERVKATFPEDKRLHQLLAEGAVLPLGVELVAREKGHQPLFHELKESSWFNPGLQVKKAVA